MKLLLGTVIAAILGTGLLSTLSMSGTAFAAEGSGGGCGKGGCGGAFSDLPGSGDNGGFGTGGSNDHGGGSGFGSGTLHCGTGSGGNPPGSHGGGSC